MRNLLDYTLEINSHTNKFGLVLEQKQSRALKTQITNTITSVLKDTFDLDAVMTSEGMYLLIPNENEGAIPVLLDVKMKPLDIDVDALAKEYADKQAEKEAKAKAKEKKD